MDLKFVFAAYLILQTGVITCGFGVVFHMKNQRPSNFNQANIQCLDDSFVYITNIRLLNLTEPSLSNAEVLKQYKRCNCKQRCRPKMNEERSDSWFLKIGYKCSETCFICEGDSATISCSDESRLNIIYANYGQTSERICKHPSKPNNILTDCESADETLKTVKAICQNSVSCKLTAADRNFNVACTGTFKYLEVQFNCTFHTTIKRETVSSTVVGDGSSTTSMPTSASTPATVKRETVSSTDIATVKRDTVSSTVVGDGSLTTSRPTSGSSPSENNNESLLSDQTGKSTLIPVAVTVSMLIAGGSVVAFVLIFRRFHRKKASDAMCKNPTSATGQSNDDGFLNMTYSTDTGDLKMQDAHVQSSDTCSYSGDSGYTDMHNEDTTDVENNDYSVIKENIVLDAADTFDDQYYAIKENAGTVYNKIVFKPKAIPDDPNYGHIFEPGVADTTYDHTGVSETPPNLMAQGDINAYSHLNQSEQTSNHKNWNEANDSKTGKSIKGADEINGHDYFILEAGANDLTDERTEGACHEYVILEKDDTQTNVFRCTAVGTEDASHNYFVLNKEETELGTKDVIQPFNDNDHETKSPIDLNDHTYFEDPAISQMDRDSHQYKAMEQLVSDEEMKSPLNTVNGCFIPRLENTD